MPVVLVTMKTVVLTGNIASGKTRAGKIFASLGCVFIKADDIVSGLYSQKKMQSLLSKAFGKNAISGGKVNRPFLAQEVFSDKKKLARLNSLVHPLVFAKIKKLLSRYKKTKKIAVLEIPLFFETKSKLKPDFVIAVKSSKKLQLRRLAKHGLSRKESLARINAQLPANEKAKKSDFVITNNNDLPFLEKQVKKVFERINLQ